MTKKKGEQPQKKGQMEDEKEEMALVTAIFL